MHVVARDLILGFKCSYCVLALMATNQIADSFPNCAYCPWRGLMWISIFYCKT